MSDLPEFTNSSSIQVNPPNPPKSVRGTKKIDFKMTNKALKPICKHNQMIIF